MRGLYQTADNLLDALVVEYNALASFALERQLAPKLQLDVNFTTERLTTPGQDPLARLLRGIRIEEDLSKTRIEAIRARLRHELRLTTGADPVMAEYMQHWYEVEEQRAIQASQGVPALLRVKHVNHGKEWTAEDAAAAAKCILLAQGVHRDIGRLTGRTEDAGRTFCVRQAHANPFSKWTDEDRRIAKWLPPNPGTGLLENR